MALSGLWKRFIPFSALKTNQREVKDVALEGVVRVMENGRGAFVFCSGDVFDRRLREVAEEAAYAEKMAVVVRQVRKGIEEGRCVEGTSEALAAIRQKAKPMACRMVYAERFIDDTSRV